MSSWWLAVYCTLRFPGCVGEVRGLPWVGWWKPLSSVQSSWALPVCPFRSLLWRRYLQAGSWLELVRFTGWLFIFCENYCSHPLLLSQDCVILGLDPSGQTRQPRKSVFYSGKLLVSTPSLRPSDLHLIQAVLRAPFSWPRTVPLDQRQCSAIKLLHRLEGRLGHSKNSI